MNWKNDVLRYFIVTVLLMLCQAQQSIQCSCPSDTCMNIPGSQERCKCCVFVFLGKRNGQKNIGNYGMQSEKRTFLLPMEEPAMMVIKRNVPKAVLKLKYLSKLLSQKHSTSDDGKSNSGGFISFYNDQNTYKGQNGNGGISGRSSAGEDVAGGFNGNERGVGLSYI